MDDRLDLDLFIKPDASDHTIRNACCLKGRLVLFEPGSRLNEDRAVSIFSRTREPAVGSVVYRRVLHDHRLKITGKDLCFIRTGGAPVRIREEFEQAHTAGVAAA